MLNIFRPKNLAIIALLQALIYYAIITPLLMKYGLSTILPTGALWLIILATLLITAGGYVINDYFDVKIDRINRPDGVIIDNLISKKTAMFIYIIITGIGVILGLIVSLWIGSTSLAFIFVVVPGMLWFYSSSYKRQFLIGNVIVAISSALTVIVVLIAESSMQISYFGELIFQTKVLNVLYRWVLAYAAFAFVITLCREIIKDIEDIEGDKQMECRTMPIVWGEKTAKIIATALLSVAYIAVFLFDWLYFTMPSTKIVLILLSPANIFTVFFIAFVVVLWNIKIKDTKRYKKASNLLKMLMLAGTLYTLLFYYILAKTYHLTIFGVFNVV